MLSLLRKHTNIICTCTKSCWSMCVWGGDYMLQYTVLNVCNVACNTPFLFGTGITNIPAQRNRQKLNREKKSFSWFCWDFFFLSFFWQFCWSRQILLLLLILTWLALTTSWHTVNKNKNTQLCIIAFFTWARNVIITFVYTFTTVMTSAFMSDLLTLFHSSSHVDQGKISQEWFCT